MMRIAAVHGVLPRHQYEQHEITEALAAMGLARRGERGVLDRLHATSAVRTRRLAMPLEWYTGLSGFGSANDRFIDVALELGEQAVNGALAEAGLGARDVDLVISTSVTGIAAPSIEARLAGRLGLRPDVKRVPVFGLGCVGGAAGIARLHDYLAGHPGDVAVLLSVELCSLTLQRGDASAANMVAGSLFGDGAAAVVAVGGSHPSGSPDGGPAVVATRSHLYPDTERLLGWDIGDRGFRIVLGSDLPDLVRRHLGDEVRAFLADHDLKTQDVTAWVCHPGGPKVLEAVRDSLGLPARALELTWRSLAEVGNLSSASVLHILRDTLALRRPLAGTPGLLLAMGPGFCSELVLLRW
ncbi:3-oxoacyl-[acyl-carrier-protein] synthase III C-terminal domain-containing protein [Streptomyces sp. ICBB 8177]|uniref:type III polyketide synthase n=1 Tax=Streptomyces sp. ICBB 8177 TaxID=563922 RepID=UPI000D683D6C|nr:3-oxoacyl-[acyl-carrier-protein] synthase III C-terminal domain-containing protein [Streptomyces sp. ICBB 8177]PWI43006.1 type III polyketide synthase [Streptomyces sp. ICBB 8177]